MALKFAFHRLTIPVLLLLVVPFSMSYGRSQPVILPTPVSNFTFETGGSQKMSFTLPGNEGKEIVTSHVESETLTSRLLGVLKGTPAPVLLDDSVPDSLVSTLSGPFRDGVLYSSPHSRTSDYYLYKDSPTELKHYRSYQYGDGTEEEIYEFKNAVLHANAKGEIEGWYVERPDLAQDPKAKDASASLLERAEWTLLNERILTLHLHGGERPDFIIPKPKAFGPDKSELQVHSRIGGEEFNQVTFSFEPSEYPAVLDPSVLFSASADYTIYAEPTGNSYYFSGAIAIGDLNNDGKDDLAVAGGSSNSLYIFFQDSTLWGTTSCTTDCTGLYADRIIRDGGMSANFASIAIGDLNSDGKDDLAVGSGGTYVMVFIQDGSFGTQPCTTNCLNNNADYTLTQSSVSFGSSIAIGDLNNDGVNDLVASGSSYSTSTGRAYIYIRNGNAWNSPYIIQGQTTNSAFSANFAIGDLNNDGRNDFIAGAAGYDTSVAGGRSYIFLQDSTYTGWGTVACAGTTVDPCLAANADYILQGQGGNGAFGFSFVLGDMNTDGLTDIVVGAPQYNASGYVYLFLQDATYSGWGTVACAGTHASPCLAVNAEYRIAPEGGNNSFGGTLALGDMNNDTKTDIVIGAQGYNNTYQGRVYIFLQDATLWGTVACTTGCLAANADYIITGKPFHSLGDGYFGVKVAIGDLNNDGKSDFAVGSSSAFSDGWSKVFVFLQDSTLWGTNSCDTPYTTGTAVFNGTSTVIGTGTNWDSTMVGRSIKNDSNGSWFTINSVSSPTQLTVFRVPGTYSGAYTISGCGSDNADYMLQAIPMNAFGKSVAVGDLNNDGKDDLVVGAPSYSGYGRVYVFLQDSTLWGASSCTDSCSGASADYNIEGQKAFSNGYFGYSLAIGDLSNDGRNDLAVGARYENNSAGRVYLFLQDATYSGWGTATCAGTSADPCLATNADYAINPRNTYLYLGEAIAIGDLNNDGKGDLVISNESQSTQTSRVYVFYQDSTLWGVNSCDTPYTTGNASFSSGTVTGSGTAWDYTMVGRTIKSNSSDTWFLITAVASATSLTIGTSAGTIPSGPYAISGCSADNADAIFLAQNYLSALGTSIAIGDLNNDAKNDLALGAYNYPTSTGRAYIFLQDVTPWGLNTCDVPYTTGTATFSGTSVTGSGTSWDSTMVGRIIKNNVNGTWYTISTVNSATSLTLTSSAGSYSGAYTITGCPVTKADYIIQGQSNSGFGYSVAIGDLNSDSRNDLAAGGFYYNASYVGRGYIFLQDATYSGWGTAACAGTDASPCSATNADYIVQGESSSRFGWDLEIGDLNNDIRNDLIVGAYTYSSNEGRVYAFLQDATYSGWGTAACAGTNASPCLGANADIILRGDAVLKGEFGEELALGQLDGIGGKDLVVPANSWNLGFGKVHIFDSLWPRNPVTTSGSILNAAPAFTAGPSDASSPTSPTNLGSSVNFTATATDGNGDQYYLAICKYGFVKASSDAAPSCCTDGTMTTCTSAEQWAISAATNSGSQATAPYVTSGETGETYDWYAFVCDKRTDSVCTTASQGTGDTGSPFAVNHAPSLGTVAIGPTCGSTASVDPGNPRSAKVVTSVVSGNDASNAMALQSDGKVVMVGNSYNGTNTDFALVRTHADGTLDTTFDSDGKVVTSFSSGNDVAWGVAIQSDGKIVVAGYGMGSSNYEFAVARYNTDGSLDTSFSGDGKVMTNIAGGGDYATGVAIQSDGKIVVAGYSDNVSFDFAVVRYNADGSLDTTFSGDGMVLTGISTVSPYHDMARTVAIQSDGKIVVGGYAHNGTDADYGVVRYNTDGTLDSTFSGDGMVMTSIGSGDDIIYSLAIDSSGRIVAVGYSDVSGNYDFSLARYGTDGTLDSTFSGDGKLTVDISGNIDQAYSVAIQPSDGKIVAAGHGYPSSANIAVIRANTDGTLDSAFSGDGMVMTSIGISSDYGRGVAIQSDGRIVVSGYSTTSGNDDFALVRYNSDGSLNDLTGYACAQAGLSDPDSSGTPDTVDIHVCSTNSFTGTACSATTLCKITGAKSGDSAQCVSNGLVPIPTVHGSYSVYVFTVDGHGLQGTGTPTQSYSVTDVPPYISDASAYCSGTCSAIVLLTGTSTSPSYAVTVKDDNGDTDLVNTTAGYLYDDTAIDLSGGACTGSEASCYSDSVCTLSNNTSGTDNQATATCDFTLWFNANYSSGWKLHVNPADGQGAVTNQVDSNAFASNPLQAMNMLESQIAYGALDLGADSSGQTTTAQNFGNQIFDLTVEGTNMTYSTFNIPRAQQKFHHTSSTFDWATGGGFPLISPAQTVPSNCTDSLCTEDDGCLNRDIQVRAAHASGSGSDESLFWKIRIPSNQPSGTYGGTNTFMPTLPANCVGTLY